jgi:Vitamin K-dependent gamma-carboxylase.
MWFKPQSPASLCLYRILIGSIILLSSLLWLPHFFTWFGYSGIASIETIRQFHTNNRFCILFYTPHHDYWVVGLYAVFVISAFSMTIGFRPKLSALILFVCLTSFHHREPLIFNSGDTLLRVCVFLLIFAPSEKMYSVDAWLDRRDDKESVVDCSPWVQNLIRFQVAGVYFHSFWSKLEGTTWMNGTALYYATRMEDFHKFPLPFVLDNTWTLQVMSWGALAVEGCFWSLVWFRPIRYYVLAMGVIFHLGIDWTMNLPFFEHLMIASYTVFLDPADVERIVNALKEKVSSLKQQLKPKLGAAQSSQS